MIKSQFIQLVLDGAGKRFERRTAALHISNIFNSVVGQLFARDPGQYNFYTKRVTLNVVNRVAQIDLPLIQTAFNAKGIVRIMPTGADSDCLPDHTEFQPAPSYALHSGADANKISGFVFYVVDANTVRFNDSLPKEVTSVLADVVLEFSGWNDDDNIPLPFGVGQMIIDGAIASLKGQDAHANIYKKKP